MPPAPVPLEGLAPDAGDATGLPVGLVLGTVLAEVREQALVTGVRIEVEEPIPDVWVDAQRLELILLDLLRNAVRHAGPGPAVRCVRVRFQRAGAGDWSLEVSDNIHGHPAERHVHSVSPSLRSLPDRMAGPDLGPPALPGTVHQLSDTQELSMEPGRRSTFRVAVPASHREPEAE